MTAQTIIPRVLVAVLLPEHVADQIKFGEGMLEGLTNNADFPQPDPIITQFNDATVKYSAAETAAQTRAKGTVPARNAAKIGFVAALHAVTAKVQSVADANPERAEAIITGVRLSVRKRPLRQKQAFAVKSGAISGAVLVTAKAAGNRASYEWQYSVDGGKTWVQVPNTIRAKTTITGLPAATVVEFRYRVTDKAGMGDWVQPTSFLVK